MKNIGHLNTLLYSSFLYCIAVYIYIYMHAGGCTEDEYRLTGGETEREGRVEVCHGGLWGTVCESSWSDAHADTVCRALNFQGAQERGENKSN